MANTERPSITYFCPLDNARPSGGVKVVYKHAEILAEAGVDCGVFHPADLTYRSPWFASRAAFRSSDTFDPRRDFLVVPEVWAGEFGPRFLEKGFKYAIFVQNGHYVLARGNGVPSSELSRIYQGAALILSVSDDTSAMISLAYPEVERQKILRLLPHLGDIFAPGLKSKTVAYMPRKLPAHSRILHDYFERRLPETWKLSPIDGQTEEGVARALAKSSVFLSFSDMEGFGLPPLEAAISGAVVVGYTGQGGEEYFRSPNFIPIASGDIQSFIRATEAAIARVEAGLLQSSEFLAGIASLKSRYGRSAERAHLLAFADSVRRLFKA